MPFKLNLGYKGKTWKVETESESLVGKSLGDKFDGKDIKPELAGYELEIMGGSDSSGFPMYEKAEGTALKRVLFTKGWGMHKRPKGNKKRITQPEGLRLRKTVRGKTISDKTVQINVKVLKAGHKHLEEIFPEQNKAPEAAPAQEAAPAA